MVIQQLGKKRSMALWEPALGNLDLVRGGVPEMFRLCWPAAWRKYFSRWFDQSEDWHKASEVLLTGAKFEGDTKSLNDQDKPYFNAIFKRLKIMHNNPR